MLSSTLHYYLFELKYTFQILANFHELSIISDYVHVCFPFCAFPVMVEDVWLPAPGQQADVNHAISSDPVECCQRHAAFLRFGCHGTDGPSNYQVSLTILVLSQSSSRAAKLNNIHASIPDLGFFCL